MSEVEEEPGMDDDAVALEQLQHDLFLVACARESRITADQPPSACRTSTDGMRRATRVQASVVAAYAVEHLTANGRARRQ